MINVSNTTNTTSETNTTHTANETNTTHISNYSLNLTSDNT